MGHGVGQAVDLHFDPHIFQHFCNKKASKTEVFDAFWSCWADSNCRPHPYQGCALPTELQQQMATTKGLEPSTSGVTGRRSNQLNYMAVYAQCQVMSTQRVNYSTYNTDCKEFFYGRGRKIRTLDTRFWRPLLYQLSYTPVWWAFGDSNPGPIGYEPTALTN